MYSTGYSSVTSFSTVASNASSTTSTRRMIIPLYNLQAHNVLTNVIVDAGTDAKIAKFQRRGLEIIGLAMLEPVEVWAGASFDSSAARMSDYIPSHLSQQPSQPLSQHQTSSLGPDPPSHTPTSSALSLTSDSHYNEPTPLNTTPTPQIEPRGGSARKFIGKIFRRKGGDNSAPTTPTQLQSPYSQGQGRAGSGGGGITPTANDPTPRSVKRSSLLSAAASTLTQRLPSSPATSTFLPITPTRSQNVSESGADAASQANMVLGIQPILNSPSIPPKGKHPKMYVWVVRKWLKGSGNEGLFSSLSSSPGANVGPVEVRFEWARSKGGKKKAKKEGTSGEGRRERRESLGIPSNTPSTSSLTGSGGHAGPAVTTKGRDARKSREVSGSGPKPPAKGPDFYDV